MRHVGDLNRQLAAFEQTLGDMETVCVQLLSPLLK